MFRIVLMMFVSLQNFMSRYIVINILFCLCPLQLSTMVNSRLLMSVIRQWLDVRTFHFFPFRSGSLALKASNVEPKISWLFNITLVNRKIAVFHLAQLVL